MNHSISKLSFGLFWLIFFGLLIVTPKTRADSPDSVQTDFENKISFINQSLKENQKVFEDSPILLAKFVDETLLPLWESSKTLSGLFGKSRWNLMTNAELLSFQQSFDDTIQRYVQEGFALYDGQSLEFVSVKLNETRTRGLLTLKVIPNVMPSFEVNFKIFNNNEKWQLYDILVQGVSYISLKKDSYRKQLEEQGAPAVLATIAEKNKGFIASSRNKVVANASQITAENLTQ